ncbi:hypothetical protein Taro_046307 [Colocasia esculenta]|uniref:DYW domain-containing protein n=1 Tax=Colocasia esculenta TaxID=4460 RepID=A0A843X7A2_COLES|nr:hypothetical protein [Colocasia esculenta]
MTLVSTRSTLSPFFSSFPTHTMLQRPYSPPLNTNNGSHGNHHHHQQLVPVSFKGLPTSLEETRQIHARMIRTGFRPTHLLSSYPLPLHSSPAAQLNLLISSYIKNGRPEDALRTYAHMRGDDEVALDSFTVPSVLKACGQLSRIHLGEEVHGFVLKAGLDWDVFVHNALIQMYAECGSMGSARRVFDEMPVRDVVSWSTMIRCFARNRLLPEAVSLVGEMLLSQVQASEVAMINVLNLLADVGDLGLGRAMHGYVLRNSSREVMGVNLSTALVDMYTKCGGGVAARRVFDGMSEKNVVSWTSMVAGHIRLNQPEQGLQLFAQMCQENVSPNEITVLSLVLECGSRGDLELGKWLHAYVLRNGFGMSLVLGTAIVDMYCKCGDVQSARALFDRMDAKDVTTWTAMLSGYAKTSCLDQAFHLLSLMKNEKVKPNEMTTVSLLSLCAESGALDLGRWVHAYIDKQGTELDAVLATALIDMYAKCGDIDTAYRLFSSVSDRDVCMWNAMISGLAMHGRGDVALGLLSQMEKERVEPNHITCVAVLHACSHSGLVSEGKHFFQRMQSEFGLVPKVEHYGCMVDLLGRAGMLEEAYNLINSMPFRPNIVVWGALLAGCKLHKNAKMGELAARHVLELEPHNCGYSVLLSNIYAMDKRWNDVSEIRKVLNETGTKKAPGFSSIEVNGSLHNFSMGDDSHPQIRQIHAMIVEMTRELNHVGYVADTSAVFLNVDEEEKETALRYHSEKLAIAFGLIITAPGTPIRIVKNLRVCDDCHAATKLLSKIYKRIIIVRDRNRFHHFVDGSCSCKDYW